AEDYTPYSLHRESIADDLLFISEDTQGVIAILVSDAPVALELPPTVDLEIVETDPSIKGGSATARTKPAKLTTGLVIQVPEHISTGDRVRVNVDERRFLGRA
ncbi:MAG: elongation factor P-like protein YeiP, partial [Marinobacter sp.]|nr:elongation factor P-like protein YeiP [Marinobacter sp.]